MTAIEKNQSGLVASRYLYSIFSRLGPGLVTRASDDDPSGIGTYSQAGAQLAFGIGWTMLFTYPLMAAIQEISARIGRTTGQGIDGNLSRHYPNWLLQFIARFRGGERPPGGRGGTVGRAGLRMPVSVPSLRQRHLVFRSHQRILKSA